MLTGRPLRVALFTETFLPKVDGIVTVTCLLLDHLADRGVESIIVAPKLGKGEDEVKQYANTRVIGVSGMTVPMYPELKVAPPTFFTYKALKEFEPDIVHIIHPVVVGTAGLLMAKYLDIPILTSFHLDLAGMADHYHMSLIKPVVNKLTQIMFNSADYSLAPSKLVQREMLNIGVREVGLWGRGVDTEKFNPRHYSDAMRYQLSDGHPDDPILIYVGRLGSEKQIDKLKPIVETIPNARLAIIGDGPERESLEKHFAGTNTKFMGYMTGEPLSQAYASADIFVFSSALETFGLVVTEAMAAGLPVVASRVGGIPDVVEEGETGYTFEVGDTQTMVERVQAILSQPGRVDAMGKKARAFAETQTWPALMDEVIDHYHRIIEDHHESESEAIA